MTFKKKKKIALAAIIITVGTAIILYFTSPAVEHKLYNYKADLVGTNRTITFYSPITSEPVKSYSDKDTRFEVPATGGISVWLGSVNKKIYSNLPYIIEDK